MNTQNAPATGRPVDPGNPGTPANITQVTEATRVAFEQSIKIEFDGISVRLTVNANQPTLTKEQMALVRRMASRLYPMANALADTVTICPWAFQGMVITADDLRTGAVRVHVLGEALRNAEQFVKEIKAELNAAQAGLAADVNTGVQVIRATLANPATTADNRDALSKASATVMDLNGATAAKAADTKHKNAATHAELAQAQGQVAQAQAQAAQSNAAAARLRLEKRFLQGETLRPQDLIGDSPAAPADPVTPATTVTPATPATAAATQGRRTGQGRRHRGTQR